MDVYLFVPENWTFEQGYKWIGEKRLLLIACGLMYYPVVFSLKSWMGKREAFDLGGKGSNSPINYIFWWDAWQGLFSIVGAMYMIPLVLEPVLAGSSWTEAICRPAANDNTMTNDPRMFYFIFFIFSKVWDFVDTIFVVLRKKKLIVLQHYHHFLTQLFTVYAITTVRFNNSAAYFCAMNFGVHAIMYSWYAAIRTSWRSPKWFMMFVTFLQLIQMVGGCWIVFVAGYGPRDKGCGRQLDEEPLGVYVSLFMYFSYLVLFAKLFYDNYLAPRKKKPRAQASKDAPRLKGE